MADLFQPLINSQDFKDIARNARRWTGSCFVLQAKKRPNPDDPFRFGLTASRKVGNAVVRNRAKRRLREVVRAAALAARAAQTPLKGYDVVIIARTATATADYTLLQSDFARGLRHLGVLS
jgi:ribonuclease P protein component